MNAVVQKGIRASDMARAPETLISMAWQYAPITESTIASFSVALIVLGLCIMRSPHFTRFVVIFPTLSLLPFLLSLAFGFYNIAQFLSILGSSGYVGPISPEILFLRIISANLVTMIAASFVSAFFFCWAIILFVRLRPAGRSLMPAENLIV